MEKISKIIYAVVILVSLSSVTKAQNFNDVLRLSEPGILNGAKALGMGNAFTAISNDLSAAIFNPAGFGLFKKMEFDGGLSNTSFDNNTTFFNNTTDFSNSATKLNQFGFVFPFPTLQGSLVFAIGFNQLKDFNRALKFDGYNSGSNSLIQDMASYNDDVAFQLGLSYPLKDAAGNYIKDTTLVNGKLNQRGNITQSGSVNSWFFAGALEVDKDIFVGATINVISGTFNKNRQYWEEDLLKNYPSTLLLDPSDSHTAGFQSFYFNDILDWDITGWDAKIGMLAKLDEGINLAASIRFPRIYTIKETYNVRGSSNFVSYSFNASINDDKIEYEISTPYEFTLGASYKNDLLTLSADAKLIDYTTMQFSGGFDQYTRDSKNQDIKDMFRSVINLNGGAEVMIPRTSFALRAGVMYMPSAFKGDPTDYDKKYITLGVGYITKRNFEVNVGYAYGWWKDYGDNYGTNISRTYQDIKTQDLIASIKFNF